jgi:hypothetical protein
LNTQNYLSGCFHSAKGGTKKGVYKERLRRDLSIASQRVLLLAACGEQNRRTKPVFCFAKFWQNHPVFSA